jgi:hypothetical protein
LGFRNGVLGDGVLGEKLGHSSVDRGRFHKILGRHIMIAVVFHQPCIMHLDIWDTRKRKVVLGKGSTDFNGPVAPKVE